MKPYPIFLINLHQRHCIVVGGSHEAEGKVHGLLDCDATVTVIAPGLNETLAGWAAAGLFNWLDRPYQSGDLAGAFLVVAERGDPDQNAAIWAEAVAAGCLVNVMDDVDHCNFVAGSVVRQGALTLSISTSGAAPTLAVRLRQRFETEFGPEYGLFLDWLQSLRAPMKAHHVRFADRRERWYQIVDGAALDLLRAGRFAEAEAVVSAIAGFPAPLPR